MKSTSGGDGSYALTVSFEVGSNPDLNTVNVTNRVNQVLALLPPEVQRLGVTTKKQSSALLQVVAVYSPKGSRDGLFLSNFATITLLDTLRRVPGVGDATLFGAARLLDAHLAQPRPHVEPRHHGRRRGQGRAGAERAGRGRPGRRRAADRRGRLPAQHHHPGPPGHDRRVRGHRGARQARRRAGPHQGHRPRRARRQDHAIRSAATTASPPPASRSTSCPAPMRWPPRRACARR